MSPRRAATAIAALVGIIATSGCDFSPLGSAAGRAPVFMAAKTGQTGALPPSEQLAVIFEQTGRSGLLSPAKTIEDETVWISDDLASLTDRQGIIVAAQGLGSDLVSVETALPSEWNSHPGRQDVPVIHRYFSDARGEWIRAYVCTRSPESEISMLRGARIETLRETRLDCRNGEQSFENTYLRDAGGAMRQSRQWLGPELGYARLRFPDRPGTATPAGQTTTPPTTEGDSP